jgi:hypothetical protein
MHFCGECGLPLETMPPPPSPPPPPSDQVHDEPAPVSLNQETATASDDKRQGKGKWIAIGIGCLIVFAIAGIVFASGGSDDSHVIRGVSGLFGEIGEDDIEGDWDDCQGTGGYSDFGPGQNVQVNDAEGNLIGSGKTESVSDARLADLVEMDRASDVFGLNENLSDEEAAQEMRDLLESGAELQIFCYVYWEAEVPTSEFYSIEVGRRGELDYSFEEMAEQGFVVATSLGS